MVMTTVFSGIPNAPTGDEELDNLLCEIREKTKEDWQCDVHIMERRNIFGKKKESRFYTLLYHVGGCLPYQLIMSGSGDINHIKAYLFGYLSGLEAAKNNHTLVGV